MTLEPVTVEITVDAPREKVYQAVTSIGAWWPHRTHPDSHVALEPWVGGQFFETWADGGTLHGTVTSIQDGRCLSVAVPPAAEAPALLAWSLDLADAGRDRTRVVLTYRAFIAPDEPGAAQGVHIEYWQRVLDALGRHLQGPQNVTPLRRARQRPSAETS